MTPRKQIILFDTSVGTQNLGDYIINECIDAELSYLLKSCFCVRYPTHTPISGLGSRMFNGEVVRMCRDADYKFLCGTNLLSNAMFRPHPNWSVNIFDCGPYRGAICVGVGSSIVASCFGIYERLLYARILSHDFSHSVRDERTARILTDMGLRAINTGCPTTWSLSQKDVDRTYARENRPPAALFTLTDYAQDPARDGQILDYLLGRYERVLFWPQGSRDLGYMSRLGYLDKVTMVAPTLAAYSELMRERFDYVGTRLHGGVYALSHGHRAVIVAVDHRATDMSLTSGIPVVPRDDFTALQRALEFDRAPELHIPHEAIEEWKAQFSA